MTGDRNWVVRIRCPPSTVVWPAVQVIFWLRWLWYAWIILPMNIECRIIENRDTQVTASLSPPALASLPLRFPCQTSWADRASWRGSAGRTERRTTRQRWTRRSRRTDGRRKLSKFRISNGINELLENQLQFINFIRDDNEVYDYLNNLFKFED